MTDRDRLVLIFKEDDAWTADRDDVFPDRVLRAIDQARKGFRMPKDYKLPMLDDSEID